jgi:hypothetical protein
MLADKDEEIARVAGVDGLWELWTDRKASFETLVLYYQRGLPMDLEYAILDMIPFDAVPISLEDLIRMVFDPPGIVRTFIKPTGLPPRARPSG